MLVSGLQPQCPDSLCLNRGLESGFGKCGLGQSGYPKVTLNLTSSCLNLPGAGIAVTHMSLCCL